MKIILTPDLSIDVRMEGGELIINDQSRSFDIRQLGPTRYSVLYNSSSYDILIDHLDTSEKTAQLQINGKKALVNLKTDTDLLLEKLGLSDMTSHKVNNLKAPMPGLILEVMVRSGDHVSKGDPLLILEAMKMENVIKAVTDVEIKQVHVAKGDSVEKNQLLIEF